MLKSAMEVCFLHGDVFLRRLHRALEHIVILDQLKSQVAFLIGVLLIWQDLDLNFRSPIYFRGYTIWQIGLEIYVLSIK